MYRTKNCPYCAAAENYFMENKVPYSEVFVDDNQELRRELSERYQGWKTVPMIIIGDRFIGGFSDMMELKESGELEAILAEN